MKILDAVSKHLSIPVSKHLSSQSPAHPPDDAASNHGSDNINPLTRAITIISQRLSSRLGSEISAFQTDGEVEDGGKVPGGAQDACPGVGLHHPIGSVYFHGVLCNSGGGGGSSSSSSASCSLYMSSLEWPAADLNLRHDPVAWNASSSCACDAVPEDLAHTSAAVALADTAEALQTPERCKAPMGTAIAQHVSPSAAAASRCRAVPVAQEPAHECPPAVSEVAERHCPASPVKRGVSPPGGSSLMTQEGGMDVPRVVRARHSDTIASAAVSSSSSSSSSSNRPLVPALDFSTARMLL
jgi:hypothetical protein